MTEVRLTVDQYPSDPTRHIVWGRLSDGELIQLATLTGETDQFGVLEGAASPGP